MHQVDVPLNRQQFIDPPLLLLALGVPGVLFGKQGLDLRRQCLGGGGMPFCDCESSRANPKERLQYLAAGTAGAAAPQGAGFGSIIVGAAG